MPKRFAEHRAWADHSPATMKRLSHANERSPGRLRIGMSPPILAHSVVIFIPLLTSRPADFEVFCYANVKHPDEITDRIKRSSDVW